MIIYSIIVFIVILLLFILLTPIFLEIDSDRRLCRVRIWGIGSVKLIIRELKIGMQLNILGWKKVLFFDKKEAAKEEPKKTKKFTLKRSTLKKMSRKILALLRSFNLEFFYLNIDTDDYLMNAWLFPLAVMCSRNDRQVSINFRGDVEIRLKIQNNLQRMLRAYLFT